MIGYLFTFWAGVAACYAFTYYSTHKDDRDKLLSNIKHLFHKDG